MIWWLANEDEWERIWWEAVEAQFKVQCRHSSEETEEYYEKRQAAYPVAGAEIWTRDLPNTKEF
jgi:hypothetical protein